MFPEDSSLLPSIESTWHPEYIDVLSFHRTKCYTANVHQVLFDGCLAILKIACWEWEIPRLSEHKDPSRPSRERGYRLNNTCVYDGSYGGMFWRSERVLVNPDLRHFLHATAGCQDQSPRSYNPVVLGPNDSQELLSYWQLSCFPYLTGPNCWRAG